MSFALKFIHRTGLHRAQYPEVDNIPRLPRHPGIIRYFGFFEFEDFVVVGTEVCDGDLKKLFAEKYYGSDSLTQNCMRWDMLQQVAEGLHQCHFSGLMHRDIKPDNSMSHVGSPF
jgi:serine/threonine protein kinase